MIFRLLALRLSLPWLTVIADKYPSLHVDKGTGMNKETVNEGIRDHNFFATLSCGAFPGPESTIYEISAE